MRFGSVCSGIEAASVAWEPLGWSASWLAEVEPFPSAVLAHHWPEVENCGDILRLPAMVAAGEIEAPSVLVGGTPCQAFSVAGKRGSLGDERGALTLAYVELANAIDRQRNSTGNVPCIIVWENVPGVLNTSDNAFGCFLAALAGESEPLDAPGGRWSNAGAVFGPQRTVAWRVLDAQYFGVAQRRRRVFVVASARDGFDPCEVLFEREGVRRDTAPSREAGEVSAADAGTSTTRGSHWDAMTNPHPSLNQSHNTGGIGASNQEIFSQRGAGITYQPVSHCLNAGGMGRIDFETESFVLAQTVALRGREGGATAELGGEIATALRASTGGGDKTHVLAGAIGLQTAVTPKFNHEIQFTLTTPSPSGGGQPAACMDTSMAVRRLTPRECERLQGFPDGHTLVPVRGKPAADGPRYKALGNSMAVPCMAWIGKRIEAQL